MANDKDIDLSETLSLLRDLIQRPSVTPEDHGCQTLIAERLAAQGFKIEHLRFEDVDNLWARIGDEGPLLVFAGHTDVVPTGDEKQWSTPPFSATIDGDYMTGRGAADMKSGVAAMVTAMERFIANGQHQHGSLAILLTSDEEGVAVNGTAKVIDTLVARDEHIDYCILGEPSSTNSFGDIIRNGRRGSLGAKLTIKGTQGHVAYPHLADNPVHRAAPFISELVAIEWDQGDAHFPPTTLQVSNIHAGTGATNVIPGEAMVDFNVRYSPASSREKIQQTVSELCKKHALDVSIKWHDSAHPFITTPGNLTDALQAAIKSKTGQLATLDTGGGTSDGRFIAPSGAQVVEFGPINATIHQINECICMSDVDTLSEIYEAVMVSMLSNRETSYGNA